MKYSELRDVFNEETDKYVCVEEGLIKIDYSTGKAFRYAIVKFLETGKHFQVEHWVDSAVCGMLPGDNEELPTYEVELDKATTKKWKTVGKRK